MEARTYECNPLIKHLQEIHNVRELEASQPTMVIALDLVVDDHQEADEKVHGGEESQADQSLLADADPWRVAYAEEDWLMTVNEVTMVGQRTYVIILLAVFGEKSSRGRHCEVFEVLFEFEIMSEGGETFFF